MTAHCRILRGLLVWGTLSCLVGCFDAIPAVDDGGLQRS